MEISVELLKQHKEWATSKGKRGKRIVLSRDDLSVGFLHGAFLAGAMR